MELIIRSLVVAVNVQLCVKWKKNMCSINGMLKWRIFNNY